MNLRPGPQPFNQIAPTFEEQYARALQPREPVRVLSIETVKSMIEDEIGKVWESASEAMRILAHRIARLEAEVR